MTFKNLVRPRVPVSDFPPQPRRSSQHGTTATPGPNVDAKSLKKPAFLATRSAYQALARLPGQIYPHRRHVSAPQSLSSTTIPQYSCNDEAVAKSFESPHILDFTQFSDRDAYRAPGNANVKRLASNATATGRRSTTTSDTLRPILRQDLHSSGEMTLNSECSLQPASERKPDPRIIVSLLDSAILDSTQQVKHHLNIHDLLGQHQLDQLDFEERAAIRAAVKKTGKLEVRGQRGELAVFNKPLRKASLYASTTMILGGREHELPILVASCVEELYRTGIYQSNLFRTLPNHSRLFELISIFDSKEQPPASIIRTQKEPKHGPFRSMGFGADTSLHLESAPDICALLSMYLSSIPEPIMIPSVFRALWDWCAMEGRITIPGHGEDPFKPRLSSIPLSRSYANPVETAHIKKAQLLLHLLPSPNFSLLVYLLAFFSQVAMMREENGLGIGDLGKMFGGRVFGGEMLPLASNHDEFQRAHPQGEVMMCWFLRRWGPISDGLFEVVDQATVNSLHYKGHGGARVPAEPRNPSSGSEWSPEDGSGRFAISRISGRDSPAPDALGRRDTIGAVGRQATLRRRQKGTRPISLGYEYDKNPEMMEQPTSHPTQKRRCERGETAAAEADYVILRRSPSQLSSHGKPTAGFEERLLDVSVPTLLNQTLTIPNETDEEIHHLPRLEARATPIPEPNAEEAVPSSTNWRRAQSQ